ncbi:MAG: Smr/MutS family protein, partial [Coprobacillus sp.]|nr:Smr/MutS family protein [Coprobacillus sp.]
YSLISSHFDMLKEYAYDKEGITNGCMIFNEEELSPTYIFKEGIPGKSYAFDVASRYGIDKKILKEARDITKDTSDTLFENLTQKMGELAIEEDSLNKEKEQLEKDKATLKKERDNLEQRKANLLEEVKQEKEDLISEAESQVNEVMKSLQNENLKLNDVIETKKKLDDLKDEPIDIEYNDDIKEGDYVSIPSLNLSGRVDKIKGKTASVISSEGMSIKVALSHLKKEDKPVSHIKKSKIDQTITESYPLELNLIGLHVDEALIELDKYLDGARVHHTKSVRIIHGYGTGALRNAVSNYLSKQKDLTFRPGNEYEGSFGATVVTFND